MISLKIVSDETRSNEICLITAKYFLNHLHARMVFVCLRSSLKWIVNIWEITQQIFFNFDVKLFDYITKNAFEQSQSQVIWCYCYQQALFFHTFFFIHFSEKRGLTIFHFFISVNAFKAKIAILKLFNTSNSFYITITLLICFFIFIRSTTKKFVSNLDIAIIIFNYLFR